MTPRTTVRLEPFLLSLKLLLWVTSARVLMDARADKEKVCQLWT
jgi:hypothetical protein